MFWFQWNSLLYAQFCILLFTTWQYKNNLFICYSYHTLFLSTRNFTQGWLNYYLLLTALSCLFICVRLQSCSGTSVVNEIDYNLACHTIHVVSFNFIHEWRNLQFNDDTERQTWETFNGRKLLKGSHLKKYYFILFDILIFKNLHRYRDTN